MPRQCVVKVHIPTDVMGKKRKRGYGAHTAGTFCNTDLTGFYKYNRPL